MLIGGVLGRMIVLVVDLSCKFFELNIVSTVATLRLWNAVELISLLLRVVVLMGKTLLFNNALSFTSGNVGLGLWEHMPVDSEVEVENVHHLNDEKHDELHVVHVLINLLPIPIRIDGDKNRHD